MKGFKESLTLRFVRLTIASHIDRHRVIVRTEGLNLVAPGEPTLGKAMYKQHQLSVGTAGTDVVQLNALLLELYKVVRAIPVKDGRPICTKSITDSKETTSISYQLGGES